MSYTKWTWTDDEAPALSAASMNHIEEGIDDLYTLLGGLDRSGVQTLLSFLSYVNARATAEGVTASEIVKRIPYSNDGLPSASTSSTTYTTLEGGEAS